MKYQTKSITVRYVETDQMQFVHHSNYLKYFELARIEWLSILGISYASMEIKGILMPVVSASLKFKEPFFFGDNFQVSVFLKNKPKSRLEFDYEIINQENEIVCTGNTVLAFISSDKKKPLRYPDFLLEKFN
tara:strand:+ start:98 stop:493 length:396 start_codon:yes stop_codon:yes gene_type:complete